MYVCMKFHSHLYTLLHFYRFNITVVFTQVQTLLGFLFSLSDFSVSLVSCMSVSLFHQSTPTLALSFSLKKKITGNHIIKL